MDAEPRGGAAAPLDEIDRLVKAYLDRHGRTAKPAAILVACQSRYQPGAEPPVSIPAEEIIRTVWRKELGLLAESKRAARVAQLRNSFGVNKRILNRRLLDMAQEGHNPLGMGLVEGNVFGALSDGTEDLARRERSPWIVEWIVFDLEILDERGDQSRMTKREYLVPMVKGLTQFLHEFGSDGEVSDVGVAPGRIYRQERRVGKLEVLQIFDREIPPEGAPVELHYRETGAYRNANEYWVYTSAIPTRREMVFTASFPQERFPREATGYLVGPAWRLSLLPGESQPTLSIDENGRHRLTWRILRPKYRDRYEVRWRW